MNGILRCSRYAFGPNRLHYCGPDANRELFSYIQENANDAGLKQILGQFKTMYPYLKHIAEANNVRDPFDEHVVEAYWIGNELLETIEKKRFYRYLNENLQIPKKIGKKSFEYVREKLRQGAVPHHSFHVLDIWKRTGHLDKEHTLESLDECRISWGEIKIIDGPLIFTEIQPLEYRDGKLSLGKPVIRKLIRRLESEYNIEQLKIGDLISVHWSVPCEVITARQAAILKKYTLKHLELANQTL